MSVIVARDGCSDSSFVGDLEAEARKLIQYLRDETGIGHYRRAQVHRGVRLGRRRSRHDGSPKPHHEGLRQMTPAQTLQTAQNDRFASRPHGRSAVFPRTGLGGPDPVNRLEAPFQERQQLRVHGIDVAPNFLEAWRGPGAAHLCGLLLEDSQAKWTHFAV